MLNSNEVEYLLVGGYALAFHSVPRYTGGIDILLRNTAENAARVERAIAVFGFAAPGLVTADFLQPDRVVQLGLPPNRIDLLTSITGVGFDEAWAGREPAELDGLPVAFIGRLEFARN